MSSLELIFITLSLVVLKCSSSVEMLLNKKRFYFVCDHTSLWAAHTAKTPIEIKHLSTRNQSNPN